MALGNSALEVDQLIDRRRLRRKLVFWRTLGVILLVGVLAALANWWSGGFDPKSAPHVARVTIGGTIRSERERVEMLEDIGTSGAEAVIISIDSPGGTVVGSQALYDALRRLNARKPVVAVVEGMAASGAYIAALGTEHIVAPRNALVGSIGVLFQYPNITGLMKTVGVELEEIKSSPLKAAPNGFTPTSPEARRAVEALVADSYAWFKGLVAERRGLQGAELDAAADGRVFTAHQALPMRLVDELGDERTARAWLAKTKGVSDKLRVRDWHSGRAGDEFGWLHLGAGAWLDRLGLAGLARFVNAAGDIAATSRLDGLLALWHPRSGD